MPAGHADALDDSIHPNSCYSRMKALEERADAQAYDITGLRKIIYEQATCLAALGQILLDKSRPESQRNERKAGDADTVPAMTPSQS